MYRDQFENLFVDNGAWRIKGVRLLSFHNIMFTYARE